MARKRRKTNLEKVVFDKSALVFETTQEDCQKWFRILNNEIFDGKLSPVDKFDIRWRRKSHAYYIYEESDKNSNIGKCYIAMNKRYKSKKFFVETLAHEMVHHWQYVTDNTVNHGNTFQHWIEKCKKRGLKL